MWPVSRSSWGTFSVAVVGTLLVCCGSNVTGDDSSLDVTTDALTCGPLDVSGFVPGPMNPPIAPHANQCTAAQLNDYAQCNSQVDPSKCSEFSGQPLPGTPAACAACIESQNTAPTWGVLVFNGMTANPNIGGCVDDALGQVESEPSSCGGLLFASYGCQNAACGGCTGDDFDDCDLLALAGGVGPILATTCKSYDDQVLASSVCGALVDADVLSPDVSNCFPDTACIANGPSFQEADWLSRMACFMCGPPGGCPPPSCLSQVCCP